MSRQAAPGRAAEDYLEALLLLEREQGEAHGAQLARRMGVSRASVSIAMKQLRQNGYITVDISASPQAKIPCCFCKYAPAMKNS